MAKREDKRAHEARALIGDERSFVIQRAGVDHQAFDRLGPAQLDHLVQKPRPDAPAGEFRRQAEISEMGESRLA